MTFLKQWWRQALIATLVIVALEVWIAWMPSLTVAPVPAALLREAILLGGTAWLLSYLVRSGPVTAAEMGWLRPNRSTFGWGMLCLLGLMLGMVFLYLIRDWLNVEDGMAQIGARAAHPVWMLFMFSAVAALSEEIVYRGILIGWLTRITGSRWSGAVLALALFALSHVGNWGWNYVVLAAVPGLVLTLFFVWKRDLGICVIGHFLLDFLGLLAAHFKVHLV
ncbi:MAG: type II CAAX prenyl endopeptidase Rce1 family protein [Novosphingobium sp.]